MVAMKKEKMQRISILFSIILEMYWIISKHWLKIFR